MASTKYPFTMEDVPLGEDVSLLKLSPGDWMMEGSFKNYAQQLYDLEVRPEDVWLVSHPKTGTTWSCEMVWAICNNADVEKAKTVPQFTRWCFPEFDHLTKQLYKHRLDSGEEVSEETKKEMERSFMEETKNASSPRLIKAHVPIPLLPPKLVDTCKVVYVARNPLDTAVSFYHFIRDLSSTKEELSFDMFFAMFLGEILPFGPYWEHVKSAWDLRDHPNLLFITYEDMKNDLRAVIGKVSKFLNKEVTEEQMEKMLEYLDIKSMKNNRMVNMEIYRDHGVYKKSLNFMRKGIVGDFKNFLTPEMEASVKQWWNAHMQGDGPHFHGVDLS